MIKLPSHLGSVPMLREARVLQLLSATPVADSWLLQMGDMKVVLREDKALVKHLGLDRDAEWAVMRGAHEAGFAPKPLWRDRGRGLLLKNFVEGKTWDHECITEEGKLRELGKRLYQLHASSIQADPIDLEAKILGYRSRIRSRLAEQLAEQALSLARDLNPGVDAVVCHNDLGFPNMVGNNPIIFVDWEYAGAGSRWFDIAGVCCQNGLSSSQIGELLAGYSGQSVEGFDWPLKTACRLFDLIAVLWYLSVSVGSDARSLEQLRPRGSLARLGYSL